MNERTTQRKKKAFSSLSSNLGFQQSTVSNSMNGFGARLANNVWDEMVFENHFFQVTKHSTINEIFGIQGLLYTANINITMTQGTRLMHMVFVGMQPPSDRALPALLAANCVALKQVVFLFFFSSLKTI